MKYLNDYFLRRANKLFMIESGEHLMSKDLLWFRLVNKHQHKISLKYLCFSVGIFVDFCNFVSFIIISNRKPF